MKLMTTSKMVAHVLDVNPSFLNSFKIRTEVGRSQLHARAPIVHLGMRGPIEVVISTFFYSVPIPNSPLDM